LSAQVDQADAQIRLLEDQLARTRIVAPFTGVVVTGDLSQSLSAPVERGEVLFEIAPLDSYRVILRVDERDITSVRVGQRGQLALAGMPSTLLEMEVEKVTPVSVASEGNNFFEIEARLLDSNDLLRPGMEGVGKVVVGPRRLGWIYTQKLVHWFRTMAWKLLP
jgi:multidrug efflux pump subunit AcrA (membrane-fusion protein)